MAELGKLDEVDPRLVWSTEATDFTPWLSQNLDQLGESLGLDLEFVDRERDVGDFSVDIVARESGSGRLVVIENQLGGTDHSHLGQLVTYAAGLDAGIAVWIATEFREEYRQAIDWLNRRSGAEVQFFGVVVKVVRIGDSPRAVEFRPVAYPNTWAKESAQRAGGQAPTPKMKAYEVFFQRLIDELREKHRFTNARVGQPQGWYAFRSGQSGFDYECSYAMGSRVRTGLYIDYDDEETNRRIFERFASDREGIEAEFGEKLDWEPCEGKRACRIACYREGTVLDSPSALEVYHRWAIERLLRFKQVLGPRITRVISELP